jgi:hypothetical protein
MRGNKGLAPSRRKPIQDIAVTSNQWQTNPKQQLFLQNYFDPTSNTFGNVFRSAVNAGYRESYARSLTRQSNKNMWLSEYLDNNVLQPEHITAGITNIALNGIRDSDRLKALQLLAQLKGMIVDKSVTAHVNIEQVISDLK